MRLISPIQSEITRSAVDSPLPISVTIVAKNEAQNLRRCLASVYQWVVEIVVVLNDTTDDSEAVCREFGARVAHLPWQGFLDTKNAAHDLATQPWVLALDADEVVSPELLAAIVEFFSTSRHKVFSGADFARRSWFVNRWIWHGDWYPDHCLRLFQRDAGRWGGDPHHTRVILAGHCSRLRGDLLHFPVPDARTFVWKSLRQSDDFVTIQAARNRRVYLTDILFRPPWRFVRGYILRLGFLDGFPGFFIARATSFATYLRYCRLYELQMRRDPVLPVNDRPATVNSRGPGTPV